MNTLIENNILDRRAMHDKNVVNFPHMPKVLEPQKSELIDQNCSKTVLLNRDCDILNRTLRDLQRTLLILDHTIEAMQNNDLPKMIKLRNQIISQRHK